MTRNGLGRRQTFGLGVHNHGIVLTRRFRSFRRIDRVPDNPAVHSHSAELQDGEASIQLLHQAIVPFARAADRHPLHTVPVSQDGRYARPAYFLVKAKFSAIFSLASFMWVKYWRKPPL